MKKLAQFSLLGCLLIVLFLIPGKLLAQLASDSDSTYVTGITSGRAKSIISGAVALASLVIALLAISQSKMPTVARVSITAIWGQAFRSI